MRKILNKESGFTLVELLIAITLGITMTTIGFTSYQGFKARKDVELTTAEVVAAIENTRQRSITQEEGSAWGIRFNSVVDGQDNYEIFKGSEYATSSVVSLSSLRGVVEFSEPSEGRSVDLTFSPMTGRLTNSKIISISRSSRNVGIGNIIVSSLGSVTQVLEDDMVAYFQFEEGSGTSVFDSSGNGNNGTVSGSNGPNWVTGKFGSALEFSGSSTDNQYVGFSDDSFWPTGGSHTYSDPLTISLWVKIDTTSQEASLIGRFDSSGSSHWDNYGSGIKYVNGEIKVMARNNGDNDLLTYSLTDTEEWHHVVAIIHTTEGELYVDGINRDSGILDSGYVYNLGIGAQVQAGVSFEFDGMLDDIRIYNRALSADEIKRMYDDFK